MGNVTFYGDGLSQFKIFLVETNIFHSRICREWCIPIPGVNDVFFSATLLVWCSSSAISPSLTLLFFHFLSVIEQTTVYKPSHLYPGTLFPLPTFRPIYL